MKGIESNTPSTVPVNGMNRIKGSVSAASGSGDSFCVKVNDSSGGGFLGDVFRNTGYQTDSVNDRYGAEDPVEAWLPVDENTVRAYLREDGTRLDKIELELVE